MTSPIPAAPLGFLRTGERRTNTRRRLGFLDEGIDGRGTIQQVAVVSDRLRARPWARRVDSVMDAVASLIGWMRVALPGLLRLGPTGASVAGRLGGIVIVQLMAGTAAGMRYARLYLLHALAHSATGRVEASRAHPAMRARCGLPAGQPLAAS